MWCFFNRVSPFDSFKRNFFVDFSVASFSASPHSNEENELNLYNKIHINCRLFNQFAWNQSYEARHQTCRHYYETLPLNAQACSANNPNRISLIMALLVCFIFFK